MKDVHFISCVYRVYISSVSQDVSLVCVCLCVCVYFSTVILIHIHSCNTE